MKVAISLTFAGVTIPTDEAFRPLKDGNCPLVTSN